MLIAAGVMAAAAARPVDLRNERRLVSKGFFDLLITLLLL